MSTFRPVYAYRGLEVSEAGGVRREYPNKSSLLRVPTCHALHFQTDEQGNRIVKTKDYGDLRVDELVARAFYGNPKNGQKFVIHKDKMKDHCWKDNLQWATSYEYGEFYQNDSAVNKQGGFRMVGKDLYVNPQGEVEYLGKLMKKIDYFYDSDTDRHVAISPHVDIGRGKTKRLFLDDAVVEAFFPCPSILLSPVLTHKDNDYQNCALSNLEWVEINSKEYAVYQTQRKIDIEKRNQKLTKMFNGH